MVERNHGHIVISIADGNDQDGKLSVSVVRCFGLDAKDYDGSSDPYVVLLSKGKKWKTKKVKKSLNPDYDETFLISISPQDTHFFTCEVYDWDRLGKNDFIGCAYINFTVQLRGTNITIPLKSRQYYKAMDSYPSEIFPKEVIPKKSNSMPSPSATKSFSQPIAPSPVTSRKRNEERRAIHRAASRVVQSDAMREKLFYEAKNCVTHQLKATTNDQIRKVGIFGVINPQHTFVHAGSLNMKILFKPKHHKLKVTLSRGEDLDSKDDNGLSDPFVELILDKVKKRSSVIKKTLNPVFLNEEIEFDVPNGKTLPDLKVIVWDWDRLSGNDSIGGFMVPVSSLTDDKVFDGWFYLNGKFSTSWNSSDPGMIGVHQDEEVRAAQLQFLKEQETFLTVQFLKQRGTKRNQYFEHCQEEHSRMIASSVVAPSHFPRKPFFFFVFQFLLFVILSFVLQQEDF